MKWFSYMPLSSFDKQSTVDSKQELKTQSGENKKHIQCVKSPQNIVQFQLWFKFQFHHLNNFQFFLDLIECLGYFTSLLALILPLTTYISERNFSVAMYVVQRSTACMPTQQ